MNRENIELAIKVMERVARNEKMIGETLLNMAEYNSSFHWNRATGRGNKQQTEEEIIGNYCGTTCCFAGWIAASPEFRELGVMSGQDGSAILDVFGDGYEHSTQTLAYLFDLPPRIIVKLIYDFEIETVDEVIERLEGFLVLGEVDDRLVFDKKDI